MPFVPPLYLGVIPLIGMAMELTVRNTNDQTPLPTTVRDFYAAYGVIPDDSNVGRTSNAISLILCLNGLVASALMMTVYFSAAPWTRNNLRMRMLLGLFLAHFLTALILVFCLAFALAGLRPKNDSLLCFSLAFIIQMCQWHEYFWTVTLAWITYCVVVDPLSSITQMIERRWRWIPLILCVTALALSWIQTLIAGVDYIGGFCYSHNHKKKIWNELSVFGPRCLVAIVISSYYLMIFWYIKRNRPIVPPVSIQLTPDPTSQTGATTSTRRGRRRLTTETVAEVLDASVPTPEPRGRPWPVGRLPTGSGESIPITDPEVLHNLDQIKVGERMIDKQVTRSIWSMDTEDIVEPTSTDIEQDPSGATTSDTAMSHETSGTVSSGAPLTRETTEARPTSVVSMVVNRLSASFLGWQTWNIGDPTPGTTTTSQQRRITMSPRTSQIPESGISASASGVSHSTALEELGTTDPNFGGPRRRQRTAPGAELLNVPGPSRFGMSHSRSESYPSRTPSPSTVGGMTASQSGPAGSSTMTYPPISTRIPSASWNAATSYSGSQTLAPSDVSAALNINTDEEGLVYNDYTPARRLAQEISPVFLVFPLSYMLISAVGLARVIHTLGTDYPNPWFHIVSRWTLLLQAPIDAITLHYISRRLGRRLRAVVEEGIARNNPAV